MLPAPKGEEEEADAEAGRGTGWARGGFCDARRDCEPDPGGFDGIVSEPYSDYETEETDLLAGRRSCKRFTRVRRQWASMMTGV